MNFNDMRATAAAALAAAAVLAAPAPASAQGGPVQHVRGAITAADSSALTIKSRDGATVRIGLPEKFRISGLARAKLSSAGKGTYIGTAAAPGPDGTLVAQEVLIFPDRMRGVGEGHRPWDLTPESTMTNATVDTVVEQVKGRVLTLKYKGGQKNVIVPPQTPVVTIVPGSRDMLVPGANVFVVARKGAGGGLEVVRVAVGVDGLVPPM